MLLGADKKALKAYYEASYRGREPAIPRGLYNVRYLWLFRKFSKYLSSKLRVLDVGCGSGEFFYHLASTDIYGIDIAGSAIQTAHNRFNRSYLVVGDAENLPFVNNCFSLVIVSAVTEHVKNPFKAIREAARVLKTDGMLVLDTPNNMNLERTVGTHGHLWQFSIEQIEEMLKHAGLRIVRLEATGRFIFYIVFNHASKLFPIPGVYRNLYLKLESKKLQTLYLKAIPFILMLFELEDAIWKALGLKTSYLIYAEAVKKK